MARATLGRGRLVGTLLKPTPGMGPYVVELLGDRGFRLHRGAPDETEAGDLADEVLIEPSELPALRAALIQVAEDQDFAAGRWDTARSWLTVDNGFDPGVIADADGPWEVSRTRAAVVISGPIWYPVVYPSGALTADVEYARLVDLVTALDALDGGLAVRLPDLDAY